MDSAYVAETWLFYGVGDLYFSFHSDEWVFDHHAAFFNIMAIEKHLKAYILFKRSSEYSSLTEVDAKKKIQSIARKCSHNFEKMVLSCDEFLGTDRLSQIIDRNYDGYNGSELLKILKDGYMETRYPTTVPVSQSFPIEPDVYHDPLSSSGLDRFVIAVCEFIVLELAPEINLEKVLRNLSAQYKGLEPFGRFKNVYLKGLWAECDF
jgi:hypothetical protein